MYMKVSEFRKDLKKAFDDALRGETVIIERGGVSFRLMVDPIYIHKEEPTILPPIEIGLRKNISPVIERQKERSMGFCKNGHPIPEGRDKCLGRGCKYS